jgi:hypothetical protein
MFLPLTAEKPFSVDFIISNLAAFDALFAAASTRLELSIDGPMQNA